MATTQHVEIEAKYDLAEDATVPSLLGVAGVERVDDLPAQVLTATYYDTADLALQRHRITLRRRTGGSDDGWHLKLPVAGGERLEVRRPLGSRSSPPVALGRLLVAVVGDRDLAAVATLVTHRSVHNLVAADSTVLAELADDQVTVEREGAATIRWRELEIELVEGDAAALAALDASVRAAGVKPSAASSKIGRVLSPNAPERSVSWSARLRAREAADALLVETAGELRVLDALARAGHPGAAAELERAVRRRRAAVDVARRLGVVGADVGADGAAGSGGDGGGGSDGDTRRDLAWAAESLAEVARLDRAGALVRESVQAQPAELVLGPVGRRLDRELAARQRSAQQSLTEILSSPRWLRTVAASSTDDDLGDSGGRARPSRGKRAGRGPRLGKALPDLTARAVRRLERRLTDLDGATDLELDDRLASARRAVDAALLVVEVADRAGIRRSGTATQVDATADVLDQLATVVSALDLVRATGIAAHLAGENGFTFGRMHGLLAARAADIARELRAQRKALRRSRRREA
jgi:hypothetical protein